MPQSRRRSLVMVPAWPGQVTQAEIERQVAAGERPRSDYIELARALDADVMDMQHMTQRASPIARLVAKRIGLPPAQVIDAFVKRRRYEHIVVRVDRLGLPLALLFKVTRGRRDLVLISVWLSNRKKSVFLSPLGVHSHMGAVIHYSSTQMEIAADRLGVPRGKLHHVLHPVDERFWTPSDEPVENAVVSVGSEARDYRTLVKALDGLGVAAEVAVGSSVLRPSGDADAMFGPIIRETADAASAVKLRLHQQLSHRELRRLYARARLVVVPLQDVDFDAGVTSITEAMAMGKAVVVTRTPGQVDVVRDGETGLYVAPGDPSALRGAIQHLLDNPAEAERMGRAGRALAESRHAMDRWVAAVTDIVAGRQRLQPGPVPVPES